MNKQLLLGIWKYLLPTPRAIWQPQVQRNARGMQAALAFISPAHQRTRDFVVLELARQAAPLTPEFIAGRLGLPLEHVQAILDDLEKRMVFLFRNSQGAVSWAYPVTADVTPHRVAFSTGEQIYAA